MRAIKQTYTLQALDADGYLAAATGAGPWTTILAQTSDGCAHKVTIASASNLSSINFTVTGTDANGQAQTEVITGPNNGTVTTTAYFLTVTSVSASSTIGADTMNVGWAAACVTPTFATNHRASNAPSLGVNISGTVTYTGWETNDQIYSVAAENCLWTAISAGMTGATSDQYATGQSGTTGMRVTVASHTTGVVAVSLTQGG